MGLMTATRKGNPDPLEARCADIARVQGDEDRRPTMIVAAPDMRAVTLGDWADRAGLRCIARVGLGDLAMQLDRTVRLDRILLDLRGTDGPDAATERAIGGWRQRAGTQLLLIVDRQSLEPAFARLDAPTTDYLYDPAASDIIAQLAIAGVAAGDPAMTRALHEGRRGDDAARLEQLSEEVRRLASTIDRLARGTEQARQRAGIADPLPMPRDVDVAADGEPGLAAEVRALLRARRLRDRYLPGDLFADPAWDMILDLLAARLSGQRVSVTSLCIAAAVPPTTALRWVRRLTDQHIFERIDDPADGRRIFIALADQAMDAVLGWIQAIRTQGGLLCAGHGGSGQRAG